MTTIALTTETLAQFYCSETFHRFNIFERNLVLTDGAHFVAENGGEHGAYWLMDAIASYQAKLRKHADTRLHDFQVWTLKTVGLDCRLTCVADSGEPPVIEQQIEWTDFDLDEITLWVVRSGDPEGNEFSVLMLPSEY